MKKQLRFALAIFAFCHSAAWGQVPIKGSTVDASLGYTIGGTATGGHVLCGNGTRYVDAATCGNIGIFYQFVSQNSVNLPQRGRLDFSNNFNVTDEAGVATLVDLAGTIHSDTSGTSGNTNALSGVGIGGICQSTQAGCAHLTHTGFATGCVAPTSSFGTCTTTITWDVAFADMNYFPICTGGGPLVDSTGLIGRAVLTGVTAQTATTVTVATSNMGTAGNVGFGIINCVAVHP